MLGHAGLAHLVAVVLPVGGGGDPLLKLGLACHQSVDGALLLGERVLEGLDVVGDRLPPGGVALGVPPVVHFAAVGGLLVLGGTLGRLGGDTRFYGLFLGLLGGFCAGFRVGGRLLRFLGSPDGVVAVGVSLGHGAAAEQPQDTGAHVGGVAAQLLAAGGLLGGTGPFQGGVGELVGLVPLFDQSVPLRAECTVLVAEPLVLRLECTVLGEEPAGVLGRGLLALLLRRQVLGAGDGLRRTGLHAQRGR